MKKQDKRKPTAIDLFCGVGGMSLGFQQTGFHLVAAIDIDPIHVECYQKNFPHCRTRIRDVTSLKGQDLLHLGGLSKGELDVLFGGPPCNGFSLIGKRNPADPRNDLLLEFARLVIEIKPRYFVVENVLGLSIKPMDVILKKFIDKLSRDGYLFNIPYVFLNAIDFGVPQIRKRLFIIGSRSDQSLPDLHMANGHKPVTVWDAIADLVPLEECCELSEFDIYFGELEMPKSKYAENLRKDSSKRLTGCKRTTHKSQAIHRFASTPPGNTEPVSRFYRLSRDGVSRTLRAGSDRNHGSFTAPRPIHPVFPRCITVREGARLHSFPDWFEFHNTIWHGFRQLGNSVPPFLAEAAARTIKQKRFGENNND